MIEELLLSLIEKKNLSRREFFDKYCRNGKKIGQGKKADIFLCGETVVKSVGKTDFSALVRGTSSKNDMKLCPPIFAYANLSEVSNEILIHHVLGNYCQKNIAHLIRKPIQTKSGEVFIFLNYAQAGDLSSFLESIPVENRLKMAEKMLKKIAKLMVRLILKFQFLHGDLKAKNILIYKDKNGQFQPMIADFGQSSITFKSTRIFNKFKTMKTLLSKSLSKISNIGVFQNEKYVYFKTFPRLISLLRKQSRNHSQNPSRFIEFQILFFSTCLIPGCEMLFSKHFKSFCGEPKFFKKSNSRVFSLSSNKKVRYSVNSAIKIASSIPLRREFVYEFSKIKF